MACLQNLPRIIAAGEFSPSSSNSKEVSYLSWQNTTPNLKTTCHIKLKFFLWTKLLEYLLLAKYLISVAAPLGVARQNTFAGKVMWPFQTVIYRFYLSKYTIMYLSDWYHVFVKSFPQRTPVICVRANDLNFKPRVWKVH